MNATTNPDCLREYARNAKRDSRRRSFVADLRALTKADLNPRLYERVHCVRMALEGVPLVQLSLHFNRHPRTIDRWLRKFHQLGVDGLKDKSRSGRRPRLQPENIVVLTRDVNRRPQRLGYEARRWDGPLLAAHVQLRFQVNLSVRQCQRMLHTLLRPAGRHLKRAA